MTMEKPHSNTAILTLPKSGLSLDGETTTSSWANANSYLRSRRTAAKKNRRNEILSFVDSSIDEGELGMSSHHSGRDDNGNVLEDDHCVIPTSIHTKMKKIKKKPSSKLKLTAASNKKKATATATTTTTATAAAPDETKSQDEIPIEDALKSLDSTTGHDTIWTNDTMSASTLGFNSSSHNNKEKETSPQDQPQRGGGMLEESMTSFSDDFYEFCGDEETASLKLSPGKVSIVIDPQQQQQQQQQQEESTTHSVEEPTIPQTPQQQQQQQDGEQEEEAKECRQEPLSVPTTVLSPTISPTRRPLTLENQQQQQEESELQKAFKKAREKRWTEKVESKVIERRIEAEKNRKLREEQEILLSPLGMSLKARLSKTDITTSLRPTWPAMESEEEEEEATSPEKVATSQDLEEVEEEVEFEEEIVEIEEVSVDEEEEEVEEYVDEEDFTETSFEEEEEIIFEDASEDDVLLAESDYHDDYESGYNDDYEEEISFSDGHDDDDSKDEKMYTTEEDPYLVEEYVEEVEDSDDDEEYIVEEYVEEIEDEEEIIEYQPPPLTSRFYGNGLESNVSSHFQTTLHSIDEEYDLDDSLSDGEDSFGNETTEEIEDDDDGDGDTYVSIIEEGYDQTIKNDTYFTEQRGAEEIVENGVIYEYVTDEEDNAEYRENSLSVVEHNKMVDYDEDDGGDYHAEYLYEEDYDDDDDDDNIDVYNEMDEIVGDDEEELAEDEEFVEEEQVMNDVATDQGTNTYESEDGQYTFIEEEIIPQFEVPVVPAIENWQKNREAEIAEQILHEKPPEVVPPTPRNIIMAVLAAGFADFKLRKVPEEHKKRYVPMADSAACLGRLTKLDENVIEAMGRAPAVKKDNWMPSAKPIVLLRSLNVRIVNEAAAMGRIMRLKEHYVTNYDESKFQKAETVDVDDLVDKWGSRIFRTTVLVHNHVRDAKEEAMARDWTLQLLEESAEAEETNLENVILPTERLPKLKPAPAKYTTREELREAISRGVAEGAWDRKYRLERPQVKLRITSMCRCRYCEHPTAYQTHKYKRLMSQQLAH